MATFETLPNEILAEFLSYLPCSDLLHTVRVSHRFHALSKPLLYKAPCLTSMTGFRHRKSTQNLLRRITPRLQIFLRTLLSPGGEELAGQVRSLRVRWDNLPVEPPTYVPREWVAIFAAAASRIGLDLPLASQSAQVVLLLHLLPRLQVLHLIPPIASDAVFDLIDLHREVVPAVASPLPLYRLREYCCSRATIHERINPQNLLILLGLPNMRRLDVHIAESAILALPAPMRPSSVTRLRLTGFPLSPRAMSCILGTTVALTHFSYCLRCTTRELDITHIGVALAGLQGTLQVLHVQLVGIVLVGVTVTGTLGSFRGWPRLRTLRCRMNMLLEYPAQTHRLIDVLPEALRELEIVGDPFWRPEEEADLLRRLMALKAVAVPALERIAVALWNRGDVVLERLLRNVCCEAGVVLEDESRSGVSATQAEMWREDFDEA